MADRTTKISLEDKSPLTFSEETDLGLISHLSLTQKKWNRRCLGEGGVGGRGCWGRVTEGGVRELCSLG